MSLAAGSRIGPYEVAAQIGAGGMGEVYRATDTKLKRQVAIKVLPDALAADPERLARFQREAEVLASLNHQNIAHLHGLEESDGVKALVMELVEGPTLADRIAQSAVPVDEALVIAKQIAAALEAAHEQSVTHRDLKPANVKIRPDGTVKVLDFGLAKLAEPDRSSTISATMSPTLSLNATMAGVILGTAAYMAPEQARGKAVDKRADIWAFGAVLFEMLAGSPPFPGEDVSHVLARVIDRDPDWSLVPPALPPSLRTCLQRCLVKDPRQRMRDIGDVRLALEGAFEAPVLAPSHLRTLAPRHQVPLWRRLLPTVGLAVLLSGLTATAVWFLMRPVPGAMTRFELTTPPDGPISVTTRVNLAIAPDGIFQSSRDGAPGLFWQSSDGTGAAERLTTPGKDEQHVPDSASEEWLTFTVARGQVSEVWRVSLKTKKPEPLIVEPNARVSQSVLSPDGRWIAYQSREAGTAEIFVRPFPVSGTEKYKVPSANDNHHPIWAPDGRALSYVPSARQFARIPITTAPRFFFGTSEAFEPEELKQRMAR
jgi:serine/threonine protein kinase